MRFTVRTRSEMVDIYLSFQTTRLSPTPLARRSVGEGGSTFNPQRSTRDSCCLCTGLVRGSVRHTPTRKTSVLGFIECSILRPKLLDIKIRHPRTSHLSTPAHSASPLIQPRKTDGFFQSLPKRFVYIIAQRFFVRVSPTRNLQISKSCMFFSSRGKSPA